MENFKNRICPAPTLCYHKNMPLEQPESFLCPYCGEPNSLSVDISGGRIQEFIVDCEICCAPVAVRLTVDGEDVVGVETRRENE